LRTLSTKPARAVYINAIPSMLGCAHMPNSPSGGRTLEIVYHLISQLAAQAPTGPQNFLDIPEGQVNPIAVPAGQKLFIARAQWKPHNNVRGGQVILDVTTHLKALGVENQ
jgi:hypothetical protein